MNQNHVTIGMHVVVNKLVDTCIYTVKAINGFSVELVYTGQDGTELHGGWIDMCYLHKPTKAQLKNYPNAQS